MSTPYTTAEELRKALGVFWLRHFKDPDYVEGTTISVALRAQTTRTLEDNLSNFLSRKDIPIFKNHDTRLFVFSEKDADFVRYKYGSNIEYGDAGVRYGTEGDYLQGISFPIGKFSPPYMSRSLLTPAGTLTLDVDYVVDGGRIIFKINPLTNDNIPKTLVYDTAGSYNTFQLWGFKTLEDQNDLCNFYGTVAGVAGASSKYLKDAINLAWDLRVNGASENLVYRMFSLIAGVDPVDKTGVVSTTYVEGNRHFILTDTELYSGPANAVPTVSRGETIQPYDTLFDTFQILRGSYVVPYTFVEGLTLSHGFVKLPSGGGIYFKNSQVEVLRYRDADWYTMQRDGSNFLQLNRDGNILQVIPDTEAGELLDAMPAEKYRFEVGASASDADAFFTKLNSVDSEGKTFFTRVAAQYGRIPILINPMDVIREFYLSANSIFVKLKNISLSPVTTKHLLNVIKDVIPAGSTFFLCIEVSNISESLSSENIEENIEVFYIADVELEDTTTRTEALSPVGYY
jgi:hypothetical protein